MLFKKKKLLTPEDLQNEPEIEKEEAPKEEAPKELSLEGIGAEIEKLKAQFSSFYELQKASTERFTRINEQVGELRAMLLDRDRKAQVLEAKITQTVDLVKTVQPEKLMIEIKKGDGKMEALRANLESNETIMKTIMEELKEIRKKMAVFKGLEQVTKLSNEIKTDLLSIQKVKAITERHADKVDTIFSEMQKRFSGFEKFSDRISDIEKDFKRIVSDFDSMKVKVTGLALKKEVENLVTKMDDFEKHAGNVMTLLNNKFNKLKTEYDDRFKAKMEKTDKLLHGFEELAEKTPDLDKYFHLLEKKAAEADARKSEEKVEKIKEPGKEESEEPKEEKKGILGRVFSRGKKETKEDSKEEKKEGEEKSEEKSAEEA